MTEGEKAIIKAVAWEVCEVIEERLTKTLQTMIDLHAANCPLKSTLAEARGGWKTLVGIGTVLGGLAALAWSVICVVKALAGDGP